MSSFSNVIVHETGSSADMQKRNKAEVLETVIPTIGTDGSSVSLLKRSSSSNNDYYPVKPSMIASSDEDALERVQTFEEWKAVFTATSLEFAAAGLFVGSSYINAEHWSDWVGAFSWHASLWAIPHLFVHKPKTPLNVAGFVASLMPLVLQPHMEISRRVSYIGAIHGSASVIVLCRALQFYFNQEDFKDWTPFRRMFFISAWGWHDFRKIKYVGDSKLVPEIKRLGKWSVVLAATVIFHILWGKPSDLKPGSAFSLRILRYYLLRWGVGFWTLLSWFNCMDALPRALHFWADGHELRHISEDPWSARTLKDFWGRRWNVPVQDMLVGGVFRPISQAKWLPMRKTIAKLMVFVVSAAGHTYAISCGGSPWRHLRAMFAFFMLQIPLLAVEDTFKMEGLGWMLGSELPLSPLFIEPILTFVHL